MIVAFIAAIVIILIVAGIPRPAPGLQSQSTLALNRRIPCQLELQSFGIPLNESGADVAKSRVKRRGGHGGHGGHMGGGGPHIINTEHDPGFLHYYARSVVAIKVFSRMFGGPFPDIGIHKAKSGQRPLEDPKCYLEATDNSTGPVDSEPSASIVPIKEEALEDIRFTIAAILFALVEVFKTASIRDLDFFYGLIQSVRVAYVP
ncbi:UNVERIFIED_CONTAM: hypothetical protein PYX00_011350 [Menopon gallinae]|uniref:Uncharacterized protein n=1 Tax=Menopon gallinae TaxID=328185 RepID=A0AAW2H769_9NEOP